MLGRENVLNAQGISQPTALEAHPELSAVSIYICVSLTAFYLLKVRNKNLGPEL